MKSCHSNGKNGRQHYEKQPPAFAISMGVLQEDPRQVSSLLWLEIANDSLVLPAEGVEGEIGFIGLQMC